MKLYSLVNDTLAKHLDFDLFKKYNVDHNFTELGLSVDPKYRRRRIAEYLLRARKEIGVACGLKLTNIFYSSDYSDKCAESAGFHHEGGLTWEELHKLDPKLVFPNIDSRALTIKTWVF